MNRRRSVLACERGGAYAESLAVIPVLIALFSALGFFQQYYAAQIEIRTEARRCVWAYTNDGCQAAPPGCAGALVAGARQPLGSAGLDGDVASVGSSLDQMRSALAVPGLDGVLDSILGTTTRATVQRSIEMPTWAGGGTRDAMCTDMGTCNEVEKTLASMARDAFCKAIESVGGGGFGC